MDYWKECIAEALDDVEIKATEKQIAIIASWIEGAHENYGMAFGHDCIPNPLAQENKELMKELKIERDKIHCEKCNGSGSITTSGSVRSSISRCWECNGEGRYSL